MKSVGTSPATAWWVEDPQNKRNVSLVILRELYHLRDQQIAFQYTTNFPVYHPRVGDEWTDGRKGLRGQELAAEGYPTKGRPLRKAVSRRGGHGYG